MTFRSILDLKESPYADMPRETFFWDLNLDQIIERISFFWGKDVQKFFYYLPADKECEDYRRAVFRDIKKDGIFEGLCSFVDRMHEKQEIAEKREELYDATQQAVWFIREVAAYCGALDELSALLENNDIRSEGMLALREVLGEYLKTEEYQRLKNDMNSLREELKGFKLRLIYEKDKLTVTESSGTGAYEDFLKKTFPGHTKQLKNPFLSTPELSRIESEVIKLFRKKHESFFKRAVRFLKQNPGYEQQVFIELQKEITFYLSFYCFEQKMMAYGCRFAEPGTNQQKCMMADGLYDLALACANLSAKKQVVSNDFEYMEGESFFVLTGPNQGGKTTFARSLGQLVYFTKMGLDVPADMANVPYFSSILTHFSVEESIETGRGKLKEELVRLKPMMEDNYQGAFVVINELFTTAANYDACIMGKKVLEHFIKQNCMGIYVTHLKELADAHERTVSLRAMLNEQQEQSFKIKRSEAEESACAMIQVQKYQLTYEQLKGRMASVTGGSEIS